MNQTQQLEDKVCVWDKTKNKKDEIGKTDLKTSLFKIKDISELV